MEQNLRGGTAAGDRQRTDHERWFGAITRANTAEPYLSARELSVKSGAPLGTVHHWARRFAIRIPVEAITLRLTPEQRRIALELADKRQISVEQVCQRLLAKALQVVGGGDGQQS